MSSSVLKSEAIHWDTNLRIDQQPPHIHLANNNKIKLVDVAYATKTLRDANRVHLKGAYTPNFRTMKELAGFVKNLIKRFAESSIPT